MNGCHNRDPYKAHLMVQDGYHQNTAARIAKMKQIESFAHKSECQYTKSESGRNDAGCDGCKWRDDAK